MFFLQGSGLLGSGPTGPGSGYSVMARIFGTTAHTSRISSIIHKAYFTPSGIFRTESRFRDDVATKSLRIVYIKSKAHSVYYHHSLI